MLNWLKSEKVDHPLGSAKELKRVLDALPAKDPLKTLEDATYWLGSINETFVFKIDQRFNVIDSLDVGTRKAQERVRLSYIALPEHEHLQEKRIWIVATDFWNALSEAYVTCVKQVRDAGGRGGELDSRVALLGARATYAMRHQMHWVLLRYGVLRTDFWADMGLAARMVEAEGAADKRVPLYADLPQPCSQRDELLRAMMFWAASPSGLSPMEQDITERLVVHLTPKFRMDVQPWESCDYCFDLDASRPPLRFVAGAALGAATRYFDGGGALQTLQALAAQVNGAHTLPPGVDWGPAVDGPMLARVLKHVGTNWAKEMPARASPRRRTAIRLLVTHGYQSVLGAIEPAVSEGLDFSQTLAHDSWIAEDASNGGYGVVVPAGKGEWLRVGVLVALRTETDSSWDIGIIRRVKGDEHRQHRIGIQLISKTAIPVYLRRAGSAALAAKWQSAILLGARASRSGSLHIVARRDLLGGREPLEAMYGNPATTVTLERSGVIETGQDFDWLRYKLLDPLT